MIKIFQGLKINVENPVGSERSGVDGTGKPWKVKMSHDYGEIVGTKGIDGDCVDCFLGPNKSAKFVYGIYQTKKDGTGFDEQKFFLGFDDIMQAKQAFFKNYDIGHHFYTNIETIPLDVFKQKVKQSDGTPIHASRMNTAIDLFAPRPHDGFLVGDPRHYQDVVDAGILKTRSLGYTTLYAHRLKANAFGLPGASGGKGIGTQVQVNGFRGRGTIVRINKNRVTVRFASGLHVERDIHEVTPLTANTYKNRYTSIRD